MDIRALISGVVWDDREQEASGTDKSKLWFSYSIEISLPFVPGNSFLLRFAHPAQPEDQLTLMASTILYDVAKQRVEIDCRSSYRPDWQIEGETLGDLAAWWQRLGFTIDSRVYDEHMRIRRLEQKVAAEEAERRRRHRSGSATGRRKGRRLAREQLPPPIGVDDEGELRPIEELNADEQDELRGLTIVDADDE